MKTTNTNGKRFNLLDLVIMVFALVLIVAVIFGIGRLAGVQGKAKDAVSGRVVYAVELKQQDKELLDYIEIGQPLQDGTNKEMLGTVVEIYDAPSEKEVANHGEKKITIAEIPNKIDVILEIESEAEMTDSNINVGSFAIKIGKTIHCNVGDAVANGTIIGVEFEDPALKKGGNSK